ncbi:GSH1-1 [Scenedesmus sp. PABB004]|nr:GSH1-1 [Scenedesmus sp. PABB004]
MQARANATRRPGAQAPAHIHGPAPAAVARGARLLPRPPAANAPSEGSTEPVTRDDLVAHLRSGCRPREQWRIGTEHEKLGFNLADNTRMDFDKISQVFEKLQSRFGWQPITEAGLTIGCKLDGQSVTLEPGGQFELSGAPLATLHQTCAEVNSHLYQVKTIGEELGIGFLGVGFDPKWAIKDIPVMPKDRYRLMKSYMPTVGSRGLDMMFRTCTIQVNLDFESEADMVEKFRIGLALQPVAVALFANSPFVEGKPTGLVSTRGDVWTDVDASRTGNLPFVFERGMCFERYVEYAMDVPMYFVYRQGQYINALGQSWRDFMEGKLPALPGQRPTMGDWENHLTTIFPEVRLKRFLEMRGADGGPWRLICALPALWVGLIYDPQAQAEAADLIAPWTQDDRDYLRAEVPRKGLATPFKGGTVRDVALKVLAIATGGLERRGHDEAHFLKQLHVIAESGLTPADHLLERYAGAWGRSVDPLFKEFMY